MLDNILDFLDFNDFGNNDITGSEFDFDNINAGESLVDMPDTPDDCMDMDYQMEGHSAYNIPDEQGFDLVQSVSEESTQENSVSFTGGDTRSDDNYNQQEADKALKNEEYHLKEAQKATERGDKNAAQSHKSQASSFHSIGMDHLKRIKKK